MMKRPKLRAILSLLDKAFALLLFAIGIVLAWLGTELIAAGGSSYYLLAGLATLITALFHWRNDRRAAWVFGAILIGTWCWALWEVGLDAWALVPRLVAPAVLGLRFFLPPAIPSTSSPTVSSGKVVGTISLATRSEEHTSELQSH